MAKLKRHSAVSEPSKSPCRLSSARVMFSAVLKLPVILYSDALEYLHASNETGENVLGLKWKK
jgi:hypothetical protein